MKSKIKRTITEVLNYETGECIDADDFFKKPIEEIVSFRSELQKAIEELRDTLFVCYYCKQKIRIRGGITKNKGSKKEIFHFAHLKDSDECHIKTKHHFSKEEIDCIKYNGAKESILHRKLKNQIAECLEKNQNTKKEVFNIEVENVIKAKIDKEWKKPDINAYFHNHRIAIELQLSTTWLDVITRRQHFYKEQGIYILWVFYSFNTDDDKRKLTYDDVIYTNNQNAFLFNEEAYERSKLEDDLILKCFYKTYNSDEFGNSEDWKYSFIRLSDLTFDKDNYKVFYFDSEQQKKSKIELENKIKSLREEVKKIKLIVRNIEIEENKAKGEINKRKDLIMNITIVTKKTINHFLNERINTEINNDLINSLEKEFAIKLKMSKELLNNNIVEQDRLKTYLATIKLLKKIEISSETYSLINNLTNWDLIKDYYNQIKIIKKDYIDELFAKNDMEIITNEYHLNQLQYTKEYFFLADFTKKIEELTQQIKTNNETITETKLTIDSITKEISSRIEFNVNKKINELENRLKNIENSKNKLILKTIKNENEIKVIMQTLQQ